MARVALVLLCLLVLIAESDTRKLIMVPDKPTHASTSQEQSTQGEGCERFGNQCAMEKWMEAHTDYIYTQDIKDP